MNVYEYIANLLLQKDLNDVNDRFIGFAKFDDERLFGLEYVGYNGLMARPKRGEMYVKRPKQGYFDVKVCTDDRYEKEYGVRSVTHYNVFQDLLKNSNLKNCIQIWIGERYPWELTDNIKEQQTLTSLLLLMFEQELNWGQEEWQRWSNFSPRTEKPFQRPRDMIMGFIYMAFNLGGVDRIPHWMSRWEEDGRQVPSTPYFGQGGYANYPREYKKYFECWKEDGRARQLMQGNILECFREKAGLAPNNPKYQEREKRYTFLNRY